jgi:hypothetical protein
MHFRIGRYLYTVLVINGVIVRVESEEMNRELFIAEMVKKFKWEEGEL